MVGHALLMFCLATGQTASSSPAPAQNTSPTNSVAQTSGVPTAGSRPESASGKSLPKVRRIFVESFGNDPIAEQMQAMVIASLTDSKRFVVTEEKGKADATLKGSATERTSQEVHAYGSGTGVSTAHGGGHASVYGSNSSISGSARSAFGAASGATQDSSVNTETIDNAHASVRLVNSDGDVIWTTTQESNGAKFKGASADVADKIAKQLLRDAERAERGENDRQSK